MRFFRALALTAIVLCGSAHAARADYFVWRDPASGMTFSFPDDWKLVQNEQPDDVVTIMPPSGRATAVCRMKVHDDRRYAVYPPRYNADIQRVDFSYGFWMTYLSQYSNPRVYTVNDGAGMGRGYASYAEAGFWDTIPGPLMHRMGLLFASLYNNKLYILECSSQQDAYERWKEDFLAIASSVDFQKSNHELTTGNYRNFMADQRLRFIQPDSDAIETY